MRKRLFCCVLSRVLGHLLILEWTLLGWKVFQRD